MRIPPLKFPNEAHHCLAYQVSFKMLLYIGGLAFLLVIARFFYLISKSNTSISPSNLPLKKRTTTCRTLVVLGSGGHTAEMLRLLGGMILTNYTPRTYIVAEGDKMSHDKVTKFETSLQTRSTTQRASKNDVVIKTIPRARKVLQSYVTSVFSTTLAVLYSLPIVLNSPPDLLLCNGPGTCIPMCVLVYLLKFFALKEAKIIYVESVCRVEHLSLSGLILYHTCIADHLFVQWPQLKDKYYRTQYIGRIV